MHGSDTALCRRGKSKRLVVALVLALVVLAVLPAAALADTHTWTGIVPGGSWNNALNWSPAGVPTDGDSLVFPDLGIQTATNDAYLLNSVGSVALHGPTTIDSNRAITLLGPLAAYDNPIWNVAETNIGSDLTISETPAADSLDVFTINGAISMNPEGSGGHALTVDVGWPGSVQVEGLVSGNPTTCSLTKTGGGELSLSHAAGNTWGGATSVQGGTLTLASTGALSQTTSVDISAGATVKAGFLVSDAWHNTFTGSGDLNVEADRLSLTGSSAGFGGTTNVEGGGILFVEGSLGGVADVSAGVLRGSGAVGDLRIHDAGTLSPGNDIVPIGRLTATGGARLGGGGTFAVDMNNADGAPGVGFDALRVTGGHAIDVTADPDNPFTISLGSEAVVMNFDKTKSYSWPIASTNGAVTGFNPDAFMIDATGFAPDLGGGTFTTATSYDGTTLYLVFNPGTGVDITDFSLPVTPGAAPWTTTSPMTWSVQAKDAADYPMTLRYRIDGTGTTYSAPLTTQAGYTDQVAFGNSALEGAHSVEVWVEDDHGATSPHKTGYFKLDSVAPTTGESTSYLTASSGAWTNVDLASPNGPAVLAASDATSGVASTQYRVKTGNNWGPLTDFSTPITITDQNTHEVEFWATDVAGNVSVHKSKYYNLDKTNPVLTFGAHNPYYGTTGVTFTWSATDAVASPSALRYQYKLVAPGQTESAVPYNADNTDLTTAYGTAGAPLAVGVYSFYCRVRDTAGNWDTESFTFEVKTFTLTPSAGANGAISPAAAQTVDYGASKTFTITPNRPLPRRRRARRRLVGGRGRQLHVHEHHRQPHHLGDLRDRHLHDHAERRGERLDLAFGRSSGALERQPGVHHHA